jgi:hypothetical protein
MLLVRYISVVVVRLRMWKMSHAEFYKVAR